MRGKKIAAGLLFLMLLAALPAAAQDEPRQEVSAEGTGFFTKDSAGNGIFQHSTDTGGFVLSYRYHFSDWLAADASYGYVRNTQQSFPSSSVSNVQADVHQATGALVVTMPHDFFCFILMRSPEPGRLCSIPRVMRADSFGELPPKRGLHLSMAEEQIGT